MKMWKIIKIFLFLFFFINISIVFWDTSNTNSIINAPTINNLGTSTTKITTLSSTVITSSDRQEVFCWIKKLLWNVTTDSEWNEIKINWVEYVTPNENKYIIMTYINVFGKEYIKEKNIERKSQKLKELNIYDIIRSRFPGSSYYSYYSDLENQCLEYRKSHERRGQEIENLYKQVQFVNEYYSDYPQELTEWILPGFLIILIDFFQNIMFYLVTLVFFNFLIWVILYMVWWPEKQEWYWDRVVQWFWYLILVSFIKFWVAWSIIALIWYQSVDFIKVFIL